MSEDTITAFILARVAEDEERANFVARLNEGSSWAAPDEPWMLSWQDDKYDLLCIEPSRALAQCKAYRRLIDAAFEHLYVIDGEWGCGHTAEEIRNGECDYNDGTLRGVLKALAAIWSDHPDYRQEWTG